MTISKREFGILCDGTLVSCWTLKGENGLTAEILDYGVIIRSVVVPDKNGNPVDVVLGYDTLEEYVSDDCYLGATIGRVANRIKGASFQLNGKTYALYANNGENHLHGGESGFDSFFYNKSVNNNFNGGSTIAYVPWSTIVLNTTAGYPSYLHELGHTLGLIHEFQRCDRDNYVTIDWSNIKTGYAFNFVKLPLINSLPIILEVSNPINLLLSSKITHFIVVEPISIPIFILLFLISYIIA